MYKSFFCRFNFISNNKLYPFFYLKEIAFNVLKKANEEIENCKWAQLRLGIIYLQKGDCNEAIRLFYNVIRNDPDD